MFLLFYWCDDYKNWYDLNVFCVLYAIRSTLYAQNVNLSKTLIQFMYYWCNQSLQSLSIGDLVLKSQNVLTDTELYWKIMKRIENSENGQNQSFPILSMHFNEFLSILFSLCLNFEHQIIHWNLLFLQNCRIFKAIFQYTNIDATKITWNYI